MLDQPYPIEFIDEGERIIMRIEEWNGRRTIHMNDSSPQEGIGTIYGHSRGRWDGNALVIETTGIGYPYYNDAGVPLTRDSVVTERYSISADGRRMDWSATTVDPTLFNGPASLQAGRFGRRRSRFEPSNASLSEVRRYCTRLKIHAPET